MKKKTVSIITMALVSAMAATSMAGCGTQANATNVQISEENLDEAVAVDEEEVVVSVENTDTENVSSAADENEYIVFYDGRQEEGAEIVDLDSFSKLNDVELHFNADTDFYYTDGTAAGYIKAGAYVQFNAYKDQWVSFSTTLEGTDTTTFLMNLEELEKNAVNEAVAVAEAGNQETPTLAEDVTDGNIVLYGGEKNPIKHGGIDEGIPEEVSIELTNVEADIPLYSGEGRLCGHLNKGGSIEITEHCSVATAWYRFPNPIEGTEYDYLYVLRYETLMASDEKGLIEDVLRSAGDTIKILDAPDSDMGCYEFSILREKYHKVSDYLFNDDFLYYVDIEGISNGGWIYRTFYVECIRNGDYFDCRVYYK